MCTLLKLFSHVITKNSDKALRSDHKKCSSLIHILSPLANVHSQFISNSDSCNFSLFHPTVFENREKMVLVMEFAAGGELYDYLSDRKVLTEEEARRIFRQVSTAIYYCHKHKICHRDLKLENILLDEHGNAKVRNDLPSTVNQKPHNDFSVSSVDCRFRSVKCV